jgi:integrase
MAPAQGQVLARDWKAGRGYALRFIAYGQRRYVTLGLERDGWTCRRAQDELANVMADVRRGLWIPPAPRPTQAAVDEREVGEEVPTFHAFASDWLAGRAGEVSAAMHRYLWWALTYHLLPFLANYRVDEITIEAVDAYRRHKLEQAEQRRTAIANGTALPDAAGRPLRPLSASSINKTLDVLQAVLATAVDYDLIMRNPASGRRRRLKLPARRSAHLESTTQITALLDAAKALDATRRRTFKDRHANVACLLFAGLRAHEHTGLRWRDVDLDAGTLRVTRSKTQAGIRQVHLLPILRRILIEHRQRTRYRGLDDYVFPTAAGTLRDKDNLRGRILAPAIVKADELLAANAQPPLPVGITPHKLRHTFASILVATGEDPASVMAQLGHTDPAFTLRIYTHLMHRDPMERQRLKALVDDDAPDDGHRDHELGG